MQRSIVKRIFFNSFWLSVLLHFLLFLYFSFIIIFPPKEEKKSPNLYVPSYVYTGAVAPSAPSHASPRTQTTKNVESARSVEPVTATGEFQADDKSINISKTKKQTPRKSLWTASLEALKQETIQNVISSHKNTEPIYLVGEDNYVSDPLILLMGKALSKYFKYPRTAGELGITGRVIVRFTLHPEGYFSDVEMLESSHDGDLDAAALFAVNSAPKVLGADRFLSAPKQFVVGFIFKINWQPRQI